MICHFLCKKGRVGRELFEFEELWFSFSRSHFVFSHPNSFSPPWGKEQATMVEMWPWNKRYVRSLDSKWGTWKTCGCGNFQPDLTFFPPTSRWRKKKVIAAQSILSHVRIFHWRCCVIFIFQILRLDWRAMMFSDGKFGASDSATWFEIFVWAALFDTDYCFYICDIGNPIFIECFCYQCESVRNVKAQLADPAVS